MSLIDTKETSLPDRKIESSYEENNSLEVESSAPPLEDEITLSEDECSENSSHSKIVCNELSSENNNWIFNDKQIFILSFAGKPIFTRYGNEDKLAWIFGVMQTLVSFLQSNNDTIKSINVGNTSFVFLIKKPIILVAVSRKKECFNYVISQLNYVFNQIASILTLTRLNKIYEQRPNYDLRRMLSGVERLTNHLVDFTEREPAFFLNTYQCLRMPSSTRNSISSSIVSACSKVKHLVFAILVAEDKLITLVRMKKYFLHPSDLHLILNLVQYSENFKMSETWLPICLPRFDDSGFLYGHVSYLAEDCKACLLLLTVERDLFNVLKDARQRIVEKLRRNNCLESINVSLSTPEENAIDLGFPLVKHYLYKNKSNSQFYKLDLPPLYTKELMINLYSKSFFKVHGASRPLKLCLERRSEECVFSWDTPVFELHVIFDPLIEVTQLVATITRLLNWLKENEDKLFFSNFPTF